jgi:hypothetical protein
MLAVVLLLVPAAPPSYEKDLRPVLARHCVSCHNADRGRGGLDLSSLAGIQAGGNSGKVVVIGKPQESLLYTLAAHLEDPIMPPGKPKIPDKDLNVIKNWIAEGGIDRPATTPLVVTPAKDGLVPATPALRRSMITALAASPKSNLLAVSGQRQVLLFAGEKLLGAAPFPEGEVHTLRFSRDGSVLLVGGGIGGLSGKVVGLDTRTWKRLFTVGEEADTVLAADIRPDLKQVALGGPGRVVKVYDVASGKLVHAFRKPTDFVTAIRFSPDGLLLAAGDRFGGLWVWEARSGKEFATLRGPKKGIYALDWNAAADQLASASGDGFIRLWDMHQLQEALQWKAHDGRVLGLAWHHEGRLASAGSDGLVKQWSSEGVLQATYGPAADEVRHIVWLADGKSLCSGDCFGEVRNWPSNTKLPLPLVSSPPSVAVVLPPEPKIPTLPQLPADENLASAQEELQRATEELEEARKALAAAEATVSALRKLVESRAAAVEKAALRLRKQQSGK